MTVLEAIDLYRFFHTRESETLALRGVSLWVDAGEMVALMGPSGSGKSTLLACLAGLDEPDGGHVELLGERLTRLPEAERAKRRAASVGVLMQSGNLFPTLSIGDNVKLPMLLARRTAATASRRSPTRDPAFRASTCRGSTIPSSRRRPWAREPGSACRSPTASCASTRARSGATAPWGRARASRCRCRWPAGRGSGSLARLSRDFL